MKTAYTPYQSAELREETTTYKIFESPEERLLRLEIKWLRNKLADIEGSIESSSRDEYQNSLKKAIGNAESQHRQTPTFEAPHRTEESSPCVFRHPSYIRLASYHSRRSHTRQQGRIRAAVALPQKESGRKEA